MDTNWKTTQKLPAPATSELSLIEYSGSDKNSNEKTTHFISCADNTIYNYNLNGQQQEGFSCENGTWNWNYRFST